jgi:hypothetical protein
MAAAAATASAVAIAVYVLTTVSTGLKPNSLDAPAVACS